MNAHTVAHKTNGIVIAVVKEHAPREQRVATVPEVVRKITTSGYEVRDEHDAGAGAFYPDDLYVAAGAKVPRARAKLRTGAAIVLCVHPPAIADVEMLAACTIVIGFMNAANNL